MAQKKTTAKKQPAKKPQTKKRVAAKPTKKVEAKKEVKEKEVPERKAKEYRAGTKKVNVYSITGKVDSQTKLPAVFDETLRPDLIKRDVVATQANRRQPYGPGKRSGMRHAVSTWGKGRGVARVQRLKQGRTAAESPNNVGGRRAHPPYPEHRLGKKINKKERLKARRSAMAAISDSDLVIARGHKFNRKLTLPIIVSDHFEKIQKTKKVVDSLDGIGVYSDVIRAENGRHVRAGKGKMRGRKFRTPCSILIIVNDKGFVGKAARNLTGIDVITPMEVNTEMLAPGGAPGRLTVISQGALKELGVL